MIDFYRFATPWFLETHGGFELCFMISHQLRLNSQSFQMFRTFLLNFSATTKNDDIITIEKNDIHVGDVLLWSHGNSYDSLESIGNFCCSAPKARQLGCRHPGRK